MSTIKELYQYREMIRNLIKRDIKGRYKGSALGVLWSFLNPLLQLGVYTIVFQFIMRNGIQDYYLFLLVALVPWIFFSSSLSMGASTILVNKDMINKIYFPREILPISLVTSQLVNMLLSIAIIIIVLIVSGKGINFFVISALPLIIIAEYFFTLGITFLLSALTVKFRDLEYITGIVVLAWQFLSPVMYGEDMIPDGIAKIVFNLNPMTSIISIYRDILYYQNVPNVQSIIICCIYTILAFVLGVAVFNKMKRIFSEVI